MDYHLWDWQGQLSRRDYRALRDPIDHLSIEVQRQLRKLNPPTPDKELIRAQTRERVRRFRLRQKEANANPPPSPERKPVREPGTPRFPEKVAAIAAHQGRRRS